MKYEEININRKLIGDDYLIYDWNEVEDSIIIYAKSQTKRNTCPVCGCESHSYHATYHRVLQMAPIKMKNTKLDVIAYKYNCENPKCKRKVFMEELPFASPSQVRTDDLTALILAVSIFLSNEGASKVLAHLGIQVSNDTIKRIYDRIEIKDDIDVEAVGIDDVAIRKGQTYATAIYDMTTHHMIALLDGRDAKTLEVWLRNHKKVKLITRDRASAYAKAINEVLPDCVQVADRFHLLQNLIERFKEIFKQELPVNIFIENGKVIDEHEVQKEMMLKVPLDAPILKELNYDNTLPVNEDGEVVNYDNKKRNLNDKQHQKHAKNRKKNKT